MKSIESAHRPSAALRAPAEPVLAISSPRTPHHVGAARKQARTVAAQHSAATPDWGSPQELRSFAAAVLKPASWSAQSIDVDGASSDYWHRQWATADRPRVFLDGTPGKDTTNRTDWEAARVRLTTNGKATSDARIGSVFENPPGLDGGKMIERCYEMLARLHAERQIGSVFWVGFNIGQLRTLISNTYMHPLDRNACTIIPGRRPRYLAHPSVMIEALVKRVATKKGRTIKARKEREALERRIERIRAQIASGDHAPVSGDSPSHDGYATILWSLDPSVRARQKHAAATWLVAHSAQANGSIFERYAAIGDAP